MDQTKHKPLRTRDFVRFFARNCGLHLEHFFLKINTRKRISLCKSNNQIIKSKTQYILFFLVSRLFRLLGTMYCGWRLDHTGCQKMKFKNGLNSNKMKYCKKKIVWNVLENNWLKVNLKILWIWILQLFVAYTSIEHQDWAVKNMMKNVMIP